jgi:hypothetical protein
MAKKYTYDDFEREAESAGLYDKFSQADKDLAKANPMAGQEIMKAKQEYAAATTDEARTAANQKANQARATYGGYTGGADGMGKIAAPPMSWNEQIQGTINQILNREKFSYDMNADALYQQYKDQFTRNAKLAMEDTMGKAATLTGGYGNSYAQIAGQQAYQGEMGKLNEIVPELYQLALDKYDRETEDMYNRYGLMVGENERAMEEAQIAAQYGDYSKLKAMGIDTGALTGKSGTEPGEGPYTDPKPGGDYTPLWDVSQYDSGVIAAAQRWLGATADGEWGVEAEQKAKQYGFDSFQGVLNAMQAEDAYMGGGKYGSEVNSASGLTSAQEKKIVDLVADWAQWDDGLDALMEAINNKKWASETERQYAILVAQAWNG